MILITGANGQAGQALRRIFTDNEAYFADRATLDITERITVNTFLDTKKFDVVINCAAFINVDEAEITPQTARKVNALGVENLALACRNNNCALMHLSTDYVFDGKAQTPYTEAAAPSPINVYGKTKLEGENFALSLPKFMILRPALIFSGYGKGNFAKNTALAARAGHSLRMADDQICSPTCAQDLALTIKFLLPALREGARGIYNVTNEGSCSRYDFAKEILRLLNAQSRLEAIKLQDLMRPSPRPLYTVLDKTKLFNDFNLRLPYWQESLARYFGEIISPR